MANSVYLGSVYATLDLRTDGFEKSLASVKSSTASLGNSLSGSLTSATSSYAQKAAQGFGNVADSIGSLLKPLAVVGITGSVGLGALVKFGFDATRQIQSTTAGIVSLTGSADAAGKVIKQMVDYVQGKPFDRLEVIQASRQLLAMGRTTQDLTGDIEILGRAVVLTGGDWSTLANIYGQASSANRVMSGELLQLETAGIPITMKLGQQLGITAMQVRKMAENGQIDFATFRSALELALPADIVKNASNTIDNRVKSLSASFRNLAFDILGVDFSKIDGQPLVMTGGLLDKITGAIDNVIKKLRAPEMRATFKAIGDQIADVATTVLPKLIDGMIFLLVHLKTVLAAVLAMTAAWALFKGLQIAATFVEMTSKISGHITEVLSATKGMNLAAAAQWAWNAAMAANPVGLIIVAIAAVVAALVLLQLKFDIFGKAIGAIKPIVEGVSNAFKLLVSGDFKGGIFGLKEDSPVIQALKTAHNFLKAIYDIVVNNLKGAWDSLSKSMSDAWKTISDAAMPVINQLVALWNDTLYPAIKPFIPLLEKIGIIIAAVFGAVVLAPLGMLIAGVLALSYAIKFLAPVIGFVIEVLAKLVGFIIGYVVASFKFWWGVITTTVDIVVAVFSAIYNAIASTVTAIVGVFSTVVSVISTVFTAIWSVITTVFGAIYNAIAAYLNLVWTVFSTVWNAIYHVVGFVIALILAVVITVFQAIYNFIAPIMATIWGIITTAWNAIWGTVTGVATGIWNTIVSVFNTVYNFIVDLFTRVYNFYAGIFTAIYNTISNAVTAVWNTIVSVFNTVWGFIVDIFTRVYNFYAGIFAAIWNVISTALSNIWNTIVSIFNSVLNFVRGVWNSIYAAVSGAIGNMISTVAGIGGKVLGAIGDAGSWLVNAGQNIVQGLINGITSMGSKLYNSVLNFIKQKVPAPVLSVLGIHSPSKLMEGYGKFTVQGLALGIEKNAAMVGKAMNGVLNNITGADMQAAFGSSLSPSMAINASLNGGTAGVQPVTTNIYGDISIASEVDANNFLARLTRNQELAQKGLTTI